MDLKAEYRRETYRNYIIFYNQDDIITESGQRESYEIPMLLNNKIPYLLPIQITYLNKRARYAYDITGKQAVFDWVERRKLKYKDCENLYSAIFGVIDACSEYLLDESNLVLLPEYTYYELSNDCYCFIYHVHYRRDILQQVNALSEFLMDHVDYEDEKAVLIVYAMYHESKRKEASVDTLKTVLQEKKRSKENENPKSIEGSKLDEVVIADKSCNEEGINHFEKGDNSTERSNSIVEKCNSNIREVDKITVDQEPTKDLKRRQLVQRPIMEERQESERLVSKFPLHSYSVLGITILVMLIVIVYSFSQGLDYKKLVAIILIVASITAYIGSKMFDPKKKIEKMVAVVEYIKQPLIKPIDYQENIMKIDINKQAAVKEEMKDELDDIYECTQLLSVVEECDDGDSGLDNSDYSDKKSLDTRYILLPEDNKYRQLIIQDFPFYIGKIMEGMDAVIMESAISRVHAKITQEDYNFYITDMGSTNGTFINNEIIQPHSKMRIELGDILRFANVSYRFSVKDEI